MPSRHCEKCGEYWPGHHLSCPLCKASCGQSSKSAMDEAEYRWLLYVNGVRPLHDLTKSERERAEAEWRAMEAEVARRGDRWSLADLIGDAYGLAA